MNKLGSAFMSATVAMSVLLVALIMVAGLMATVWYIGAMLGFDKDITCYIFTPLVFAFVGLTVFFYISGDNL